MQDLSGQNLGRYRIIEPIGEGGMASVFKAYQHPQFIQLLILAQLLKCHGRARFGLLLAASFLQTVEYEFLVATEYRGFDLPAQRLDSFRVSWWQFEWDCQFHHRSSVYLCAQSRSAPVQNQRVSQVTGCADLRGG